MRKFTLTAIVTQDSRVVGAFQLLSLSPRLDGEVLQAAVGKFIEKPYQKIVYGGFSMIYLDPKLTAENSYTCAHAEVIAFAVWRAAGALLHSKSLETEVLKHGSNWLVALDDEPYLVKFVLEDQAQNYIVLHALPDLEMPIVIKDSGWLPTSVPETLNFGKFSNEFGDKGVVDSEGFARPKEVPEHNQAVGCLGHESPALEVGEDTAETAVLPDTVLEPARISSAGAALRMKEEFNFNPQQNSHRENKSVVPVESESVAVTEHADELEQEDSNTTETVTAFVKEYLAKNSTTALDSGMFEKPLSEGFAEGLGEIHDQMLESRSASKALLTDEQEGFLAEAALRGQTAELVMTDNGTFILSGEVLEQVDKSRSASKALLSGEQEGLLAETSLFGQNAAIVMLDEPPYIPSEEVHGPAKAVLLGFNPVHNYYDVDIASSDEYRKFCEKHKASEAEALAGTTTDNYTSPAQAVNSLTKGEVDDVPTNHAELNNPTLEI